MPTRHAARCLLAATLALISVAGCRGREPQTEAERLAYGREVVQRMSAKLASLPAFSVTTREVRDQPKPSGKIERVTLVRETMLKRPDRLYFKTTGDARHEGWYDGVGLTIALHENKVFGQARMPETIDKTLDAMHERYGVAAPVADYLYSTPASALLTDSTTGGWVGRETVNGVATDHVAFKDKGVSWEVWIPTTGDPLPVKAKGDFPEDPRLRAIEITFENWNQNPTVAADRFTPRVPGDYEGIAMIQRARVLRNMPKDDAAPAPPPPAKK